MVHISRGYSSICLRLGHHSLNIRDFFGMLTPIVKAKSKKGKKELKFYSVKDFDKWKENNNDGVGWDCKYYKGSGTSTPAEAKEYFREFKLWFTLVTKRPITIQLNWHLEKQREAQMNGKIWLSEYDRGKYWITLRKTCLWRTLFIRILFTLATQTISGVFCSGLIGLKPSQRKVLFGCFKRNLVKEIRVAQLDGYISEHCAYHHGEASLQSTIVGMAQDFVCSNNINLLFPNGQFGLRS